MVDPVAVPPPPSAGAGEHGGGGSRLPRWAVPALAAAAVAGLLVLAVIAFTQRQEAQRLRVELAQAEDRVAELESRIDELERGGGMGGLGDLLEQFLGGEGPGGLFDGGLDGLLESLPGEGPDELLGSTDLTSCLPDGGLAGLLGGADPIAADDLSGQLEAVAQRVEGVRGLRFADAPEPALLPSEQFEARLTALAAEDYTAADADFDRRTLAALGAVPADIDLRGLLLDLVGEQAAGFYSSETGELVVRADPRQLLGPNEQVILAHELQHAVADQAMGLPVDDERVQGDAARAGLALVEGDASLTMQHFALDALDLSDQLAIASDPSMLAQQEQLADYPQYLQRDLLFPYTEGIAFVCALYADGGWATVDRAYDGVPTTTAQILWPQRYASGEQATGDLALGAPGGSWDQARAETFGAAELLWLFSAPGDDPAAALDDPRGRAAAWAGGIIELWTDGPASAVGVALAERDGEQGLCDSVTRWYEAAFPGGSPVSTAGGEALAVDGSVQDAVVSCSGGQVRVGIAPQLATARAIVR